jgi:hypothetical protein
MEDIPANLGKSREDSCAPSAMIRTANMWCLMFDDGASLPKLGDSLPPPVLAQHKASSSPALFVGAAAGGQAKGAR